MKVTTLIDIVGSRERVINGIMEVYDSGDRNKMLKLASEIVDLEAKNSYECGTMVGKWQGRFIGLAILCGLYAGANLYTKYKETIKKENNEEG